MAAPLGNTYAAEGKRYKKALERALAHAEGSVDEGLFAVAKARVAKAIDGDGDAAKEIGDRLDGKVPQAIIGGNPDDPPIKASLTVEYVGAKNAS